MKRVSIFGLLGLIGLILMGGQVQATLIPIANPSFEADQPDDSWKSNTTGKWLTNAIDSWSVPITGTGIFQPASTTFKGGIPDGVNSAYINQGSISQALSATLQPGNYTLTFYVGHRWDFLSFPGYTVQLLAGDNVLATSTGPAPQRGYFEMRTLTFTALADNPYLGQVLGITLQSPGVQANFDNIGLDFVNTNAVQLPIPPSAALLGSGLVGLLALRRRKNQ